jgi:hypothetical protein
MDVKVDGVPVVGIQIGVNRFIEIPDKVSTPALPWAVIGPS